MLDLFWAYVEKNVWNCEKRNPLLSWIIALLMVPWTCRPCLIQYTEKLSTSPRKRMSTTHPEITSPPSPPRNYNTKKRKPAETGTLLLFVTVTSPLESHSSSTVSHTPTSRYYGGGADKILSRLCFIADKYYKMF